MKLRDLKKLIDECIERAEDTNPDVYLYYGKETELEIIEVTQFSIVPDVTIKMKKVKYEKS
jgi:hypothetical protein